MPTKNLTVLDDSSIRKVMLAIVTQGGRPAAPAHVHVLRHMDSYGHLVPGGNRSAVDRLDERILGCASNGPKPPALSSSRPP